MLNTQIFAVGGSGSMSLIMLVAMFGLMYFLLIRPQKKQMNIRNEMLANLSVGDRIITTGGITGYIRALTDEYIYVEIAEGLTVEMIRQAVSQVIADTDESADASDEELAEDETIDIDNTAEDVQDSEEK